MMDAVEEFVFARFCNARALARWHQIKFGTHSEEHVKALQEQDNRWECFKIAVETHHRRRTR